MTIISIPALYVGYWCASHQALITYIVGVVWLTVQNA